MKKVLTREQAQTSKARAARFALNVLQDPYKAQAIDDESLEDWIERKKIRLSNPARPYPRRASLLIHESEDQMPKFKKSVAEQIEDLKAENKDLRVENEDLQDRLDAVADLISDDDDDDSDDDGDKGEE